MISEIVGFGMFAQLLSSTEDEIIEYLLSDFE